MQRTILTSKTTLFLAVLLAAGGLSACDKNDDAPAKPETESRFARLLVTDKASSAVTLLDPSKKEQTAFQSAHGGSTVYASAADEASQSAVLGT